MADNREEKEIDLLGLFRKLWGNKRYIIKVTIIGAIVGFIIAFSIPKEYTSTVTLTPESKSTGSGGAFGSLASLAGINLASFSGNDALTSPYLYSEVLYSTPFIKELLSIQVKDTTQDINTTLYIYMRDCQASPWWRTVINFPFKIIKLFKGENKEYPEDINNKSEENKVISKEEMKIIQTVQNSISITLDKKTELTSISFTAQSPEIAAYLVDSITSHLQSYIIDYRTKKARNDLQYIKGLYDEAQLNYYQAQSELAKFKDGNKHIVSAKYNVGEERLQNEVDLAFSVYNQTAQQLQVAKIKIQDKTPVFTIIQPAIHPFIPSKPQKKLIIGIFIFFFFTASSLWILRGNLFEKRNNVY